MILRILFLTCALFLSPSLARMDFSEFSQKFEDNCFQNEPEDPFRVNGQNIPLSNTMENFIAMCEKFEAANPGITLKEELEYFISEFLFENIKISGGKISERPVERAKLDNIESFWDPDKNSVYKPEHTNPFSVAENCSLYFMISHSMLEKDTLLKSSMPYNSSDYVGRTDLNPDDYYPQEIGVVAVRGSDGPVSLSKVLLGLLVGLKPSRKTELKTFPLHFKNARQEELERTVDALYVTTLAEVLMLSSWEGFERAGLAGNGEWVSIPLNGEKIEGFCPMVYKQSLIQGKFLPAYSYSSIRGAADGLILGLTINKIAGSDTKLSQVLRMYYSPRGIITEDNIEDINGKQVSFCSREILIQALEQKLQEQMMSYGYLTAITENDIANSYTKAKSRYEENKNSIFRNSGNSFCIQPKSLDRPEDLQTETFLDIIVVMDSSNTEKNFNDQQLIIGYLARQLDLMYSGSRMTILLDRKNETESGKSSKIRLEEVVNNTYSFSCAACYVGQMTFKPSTLSREDVIIAIDQLLYDKKMNNAALNGVNGKIVIYFNYENGDGRSSNNRVQENIDRALRDFNMRHLDVFLYAVGLDPELLKKYARNDPSLVFLGTDDKPAEVADKILKKILYYPGLLQYSDCEEHRNEKSATFENFVSPNKLQHYTMPAEYFYKSFKAKVVFESQNGLIRVCYNRGTMRPENEIKNCKDTTPNTGVEFHISNPCKGFTKESCSPLYFAVVGIDPVSETSGNQVQRQRTPCKINDRWCSALDQIKFKVSHEGIQCSGSLGLYATPFVYLFAGLLAYFISNKF